MNVCAQTGLSAIIAAAVLAGIAGNAYADPDQPREPMKYNYVVEKVTTGPALDSGWESADWKNVKSLAIANFLTDPKLKVSDHRPQTMVKLVYDDRGVYALFQAADKYVKCVNTNFQSATCDDSCVEFFIRPKPSAGPEQGGYFNFEINCGGAVKCRYTKIDKNDRKISTHPIDRQDRDSLKVFHSLPATVDPEIEKETVWTIGLFAPFEFLERYVGPLGDRGGQQWRVNFYKCGNKTSHPHYGAWAPVDVPDFHTPRCFGTLEFGK